MLGWHHAIAGPSRAAARPTLVRRCRLCARALAAAGGAVLGSAAYPASVPLGAQPAAPSTRTPPPLPTREQLTASGAPRGPARPPMTPEQARAAAATVAWPSLASAGPSRSAGPTIADSSASGIRAIVRAPSSDRPSAGDRPPALLTGIGLDPARQTELRAAWQREFPRWQSLAARRRQPGGLTDADRAEMDVIAQRQMARVVAGLRPEERVILARNVAVRRAWIAARQGSTAAQEAR